MASTLARACSSSAVTMAGSSSGVTTCRMYGATCPLASECTKGGHYFKSPDPEKAVKMLANHLKTSTYHLGAGKISAEQVDDLMETIALEEWEEEVWDHTNGEGQFESHHGAWAATRKRKNVQAEIPEGAELTRIAKMHRQSPMQIQQAFCGGPPIVRKRMPSRTLVDVPIDAQVTIKREPDPNDHGFNFTREVLCRSMHQHC